MDGGGDSQPTTYWLLSLPVEGRLPRTKEGADQVLAVLKDKTGDFAATHKAR